MQRCMMARAVTYLRQHKLRAGGMFAVQGPGTSHSCKTASFLQTSVLYSEYSMPPKAQEAGKPRKLAVAARREDGLGADGLPIEKYQPEPGVSAQSEEHNEPPERLLSDDDILRLLDPKWRDSIGLQEMHKWLAANTENVIRLHTTCGALSTFWEPRKDANGASVVTMCHFWRMKMRD